ncbi:unknown [Bacteroides sp. CAG:875]|nr:unknown [Bacteroides sp. CAG:875]
MSFHTLRGFFMSVCKGIFMKKYKNDASSMDMCTKNPIFA